MWEWKSNAEILRTKRGTEMRIIRVDFFIIFHSISTMHQNFRYIIFVLVLIIFYELYLILYYKYTDYQVNDHIAFLNSENTKLAEIIAEKESYNIYIRTPAYETRIAKASQWKKLPGEEVINIISSDDVKSNALIDVNEQIQTARKSADNPTKWMSNPEKWIYYLTVNMQ